MWAAEGEQTGLVALHQRLESAVVAAASERDQPLVALQPEEGRPARKGGGARLTVGEAEASMRHPWGRWVPRTWGQP